MNGTSAAPIAIVVSNKSPVYMDVADAVIGKIQRPYYKYSLDNARPAVIRELIARQGITDIVAIGAAAAATIQPDETYSVVYSQVLHDRHLLEQGYHGVAALPPFQLQLQEWVKIKPDLRSIGVISSAEMGHVVRELRQAAETFGLAVEHREVDSDQAALFVFQRMVPMIDGYVFLPDTHVLSPSVIEKVMRYAAKHNISIIAYNRPLAELGAAFVATSEADDVAEQMLNSLAHGTAGQRRPLTRMGLDFRRVARADGSEPVH